MTGTDQTAFRAAMMDPGAPVPASLTDGAGRSAGRRFSVYRNNVAVSLTEALIDGFPACHAVLGDEMFRGMAAVYLRAHPPASPLMMRFGADLPAFLDAAPQLARMRWIGDLARLEYLMRDSYHAADGAPLSSAALSAIAPDALDTQVFALAPPVRVLRSAWPVLAIRARALDPDAPQAQPGPQDVLITRPDYDPQTHLLNPGDVFFLAALQKTATLAAAAAAAGAACEDHDPTPILTLLMQSRSLCFPEDRQ